MPLLILPQFLGEQSGEDAQRGVVEGKGEGEEEAGWTTG